MNNSLGLRVAALKALRDYIDDAYEEARAALTDDLADRYAHDGSDRRAALLPDGTKVALATLLIPHATCTVPGSGESDYRDYVRDLWPDQIETVPAEARVRPVFRRRHLEELQIVAGQPVEPNTGEIVPGVVVVPAIAPCSFRLTFADHGKDKIAEAWRAGLLADLLDFQPAALRED